MSVRCRTCGEYIYNLNAKNIFDNDSILHKIEALTGIWLTDDLDMPEHICACCLIDLNHAISFRERCIKTHRLLLTAKLKAAQDNPHGASRSLLEGSVEMDPLNSASIKDEYCETKDDDEAFEPANEVIDDVLIEALSDFDDDSEFIDAPNEIDPPPNVHSSPEPTIQKPPTTSYKMQKLRVVLVQHNIKSNKKKTHVAPAPTSKAAPTQPHPAVTAVATAKTSKVSTATKAMATRATNLRPAATATPRAAHAQTAAASEATNTTQVTVKKKKKKYPSRTGYVCDQCGRRFKDVSNFNVHMVHHKGIKEFECTQCDKKYYQAYHLNLHIRVRHKGEKPFGCNFCEERFYTSTSRCRHERTHMNKKAYVCKTCNKGFIHKTSLTAHEVLHKDDRPHRCETCDMGFKQKQYLRTHNRSKQHLKKLNQALDGEKSVEIISAVDDDIDFEFSDSIIEELDE